jgi:phosphatidylglycerophosphate synthase
MRDLPIDDVRGAFEFLDGLCATAGSSRSTTALIVCQGGQDPLRLVGGLTLIERLLRQLREIRGIESITVVCGAGFEFPGASERVTCPVQLLTSTKTSPWEMVAEAIGSLPIESQAHDRRTLVVAGDLLVDQRLFDWLANAEGDVLVASRRSEPPMLLGAVTASVARRLGGGKFEGIDVRPVETFDTYVRKQRGNVPIHLMSISSSQDEERGWAALFDNVEKRTKDLPATYFDPPFENFLVRLLAPTAVTPNQVTLATGVIGFFVAWLFLEGWLVTGLLIAIFVEVLDGVDGKLARIKRMTSKAGELEHVLDFFYENCWYLGLGAYLAANGSPWAWQAAWVLCAADVADNLSYVYYARRVGGAAWHDYLPSLDDGNGFLRRFRLVAGRRNIYVWAMLPGFIAGVPAVAFGFAVAWGVFTAATHWAIGHLISRIRRSLGSSRATVGARTVAVPAGMRMRPYPERSRRSDSGAQRFRPSDRPPQAARGH